MMNYEEFKEIVKERFMDYMPEEYKDAELDIRTVNKVNNKVLDGIYLKVPGLNYSPTLYINDMYNHYILCNDLDEVLKQATECMEQGFKTSPVTTPVDFSTAKDNVIFQLINTKQNKEFLSEVPHRDFLDLSIIYRVVVDISEKGVSSAIINNSLATNFGNEQELFDMAMENTKRLLPPSVKSLGDVFNSLSLCDDDTDDPFQILQGHYVISNSMGVNGAATILYDDVLSSIADNLDSNLYILPSSIHDVIVLPTAFGIPNSLRQMVHEVNTNAVVPEEVLSNEVYHYDRITKAITIA